MNKGYSVGLVTMSVMASCPVVAASYSMAPAPMMSQPSRAKSGVHFDIGVLANIGYASTKYTQYRYEADNVGDASDLFELKSMHVHRGPAVSPTVFAGLRYYMDKSFVGFHIGDTFTQRKVFSFEADDRIHYESVNFVKSELTSSNTVYGKLFLGYFLTKKTDLNIGVLGLYDRYRLNYKVDAYHGDDPDDFVGFIKQTEKFGLGGYGISLGAEHFLSDYIILSLNYTFIQHNSKTEILEGVRFGASGGGIVSDTRDRFDFRSIQENIVSLGLIVEV